MLNCPFAFGRNGNSGKLLFPSLLVRLLWLYIYGFVCVKGVLLSLRLFSVFGGHQLSTIGISSDGVRAKSPTNRWCL